MNSFDQHRTLFSAELKLSENEFHIWLVHLRVEVSVLHALQRILMEEEVIKARLFRFERGSQVNQEKNAYTQEDASGVAPIPSFYEKKSEIKCCLWKQTAKTEQ